MSQNQNEISQEEKEYQDDLMKRIKEVDEKLAAFKQTTGGLEETENKIDLSQLPTINPRGEKVISTEEMRRNYENSFPFFRLFELPYCKKSIVGKVKFCLIGGLFGAFSWEYKTLLDTRSKLRDFSGKRFFRNYLLVSFFSIVLAIGETIIWDDFCDINSYHYNESLDRRSRMQRLKKEAHDR